jgi:hypothetical protein
VAKKEEGIRDPFFPQSTRSWNSTGLDDPSRNPPSTVEERVERYVTLRGITGQAGDKVALLNNQTFKAGDTVSLRLRDGQPPLNVTMQKVLDVSVEFTVEGATKTFEKQLEQQ